MFRKIKKHFAEMVEAYKGLKQAGVISVKSLITGAVGVVILATAIPVLWPMIADSDTTIQAMNGTDDGTAFIQSFWPIGIMIGGIGIGVGLVYMLLKKFNVVGN